MSSTRALLHPDGRITVPRLTRAEILARMEPCLWAVSPRERRAVTAETCLVSDLWLTGHGVTRLGELLEEEFRVTLTTAALIGLVMDGPSIGNLMDLVEAAHV